MPLMNQQYIENQSTMGYKLFLPKSYDGNNAQESFPLILLLHGIKKRGNDLSLLDSYGILSIAEQNEDFPYILVVPQCPPDTFWPENRNMVLGVLNQVTTGHRVDRKRVYLTGFSMGGNGVWDLAANTRGLFAAAAPLAGWYDANAAEQLVTTPIWAFHGEDDDIVPCSKTEEMVQAVIRAGGAPKFTTYPGLKHPIMVEVYGNPKLYEWFSIHELPEA